MNTKECSEYYGAHMTTERMICAKSRNDTSQKCLGDTGGKLDNRTTREQIVFTPSSKDDKGDIFAPYKRA